MLVHCPVGFDHWGSGASLFNWPKYMRKLDQTSTFNGERFSKLPIVGTRDEDITPTRTMYINKGKNKVLLISEKGNVKLSISSGDGSELNIENLYQTQTVFAIPWNKGSVLGESKSLSYEIL